MKTLEQITEEMKNSKMSDAQITYAIAKCWYEVLHEADKEIEKKVLEEHPFYILEDSELQEDGTYYFKKGTRIYDSCELDLDGEQWNEYQKLYYTECTNQGIEWEWGKTIDGEAFYAKKAAEEVLLDWFEESVAKFPQIKKLQQEHPDSIKMMRSHWKYREQLIDMCMKWNSDWEKYSA